MVKCLWYLDGHYDKLKKQSCPVPELCLTFTGYNTPEISKHRKRQSSNMSASTLNSLASSLFRILQASFWSKTCFKRLHDQTQGLSRILWLSLITKQIDKNYSCTNSTHMITLGCSSNQVCAALNHCCTHRHYSCQIKKCGSDTCDTCNPVRLPKNIFDQLSVLPDPVPGDDGHYKTFAQLFGTKTDGSHRPSLQKTSKRKKTLPFTASVQHLNNMDIMLQCDKCSMWRLLYCRFKLTKQEKSDLQKAIEDVSVTCGAQLQDWALPGQLSDVYTREMSCVEPIEKLYYLAKYSPICIYCA